MTERRRAGEDLPGPGPSGATPGPGRDAPGRGPTPPGQDVEVGDPLYLDAPEPGVEVLETLVADHDWERLARYYDLSDAGLEPWYVVGGYLFTDEPAPHVAVRWDGVVRYRHPFPPGFAYVDHDLRDVDGRPLAVVTVGGTYEPGDGRRQTGPWRFDMVRRDPGWQVLPSDVRRPAEGAT